MERGHGLLLVHVWKDGPVLLFADRHVVANEKLNDLLGLFLIGIILGDIADFQMMERK